MFHLTTGTYSELESTLCRDIHAAKRVNPLASLVVLSPSGQALARIQRELATSKAELNIHFLTFHALAERILMESPVLEGRQVTESALYREIVQDYLQGTGDVPFLSRSAYLKDASAPIPKGLTGALASTLKDLQDSGARVVDCAAAAREGHLGEAADSAIPILELNVLMYKTLHDRGLRTGADRIRRATERVPQSDWLRAQEGIFLYGFYDLTGVQLDLVTALCRLPGARVYFPYVSGVPAYGYAENLLLDPAFAGRSAITPRHPVSEPPRPATEVWSCSGTHDEVWLTAKKILQRAKEGVAYGDMAIIARTLDPYLNTLEEILTAHQIPYALHAEVPVNAYPLVKSARELLNSPAEDLIASWTAHVEWASHLLARDLHLPPDMKTEEYIIWQGILDTLNSLKHLDALARPVTRVRFLEVLNEKFQFLRLPLSPTNTAGVQIMDIMTARGLQFDSAFIIGLNEKLFPRLIREDAFLSDSARSRLSQALGCRLGRKMDGFQEEKLLFHLATELATNQLHLSTQRSDEEGKALVMSLYLHDYLATHKLELKRLPRSWGEKITLEPWILTPKELSLALHREDLSPDALYEALGWDRALWGHLLKSQQEMESFKELGAHDGLIGKNHPLAKAILDQGLSAATLKDMAECPFKIMGKKVLSLYAQERDVEEGVFTQAGLGKTIHRILERCYQSYSEDRPIDYKSIAQEEFILATRDHPDLYPLAWEAEQARVLDMLERFIPEDLQHIRANKLIPRHPELILKEEVDGLILQGRVDRVDETDIPGQGYRIVDYKTGSAGVGKKEKIETAIMKGKTFQLPLYMMLVEAWLKRTNPKIDVRTLAKGGSAVFARLEEGQPPLTIDSEFWEEYGDDFRRNIKFLADEIRNGTFFIRPSDSHGYCSWCTLSAACRKEHKPTQWRTEHSKAAAAHESSFSV